MPCESHLEGPEHFFLAPSEIWTKYCIGLCALGPVKVVLQLVEEPTYSQPVIPRILLSWWFCTYDPLAQPSDREFTPSIVILLDLYVNGLAESVDDDFGTSEDAFLPATAVREYFLEDNYQPL